MAEIDEERLRGGLRGLVTMDPPSRDSAPVRPVPWIGRFALVMATVLLLAGVLTVALLLRRPASVATTPPRATASIAPTFTVQPTPTPASTPLPTPAPVPTSFLPAVGPPCTASQLEVRLGSSFGALGNGITYVIFTDRGTRRCTLRGTPSVQLLDARGRPLSTPATVDRASGYVPTLPNGGVGLLPLSNEGAAPGSNPEGGIRGQASLPIQYQDGGCNSAIAAIRIRVGGGTFTVRLTLAGGPGCQPDTIFISPFQPAEFLP
ncbi:MAG: DUF4232 domain-containing protein [Candidatus Dormiibacterota bacterium]